MRRYGYLPQFVANHNCKNIMEIGVWNGGTGRHMIESAVNKGLDNVAYFGFDLFEDFVVDTENGDTKVPPPMNEVKERVTVEGAYSELFQGDSRVTIPEFVKENSDMKMDMIFIDGGHGWENIQTDWDNVQPLIHEKTVIVFDEYWLHELNWGSNRIVDNLDMEKWNVEVMPLSDSCDWEGRPCKLHVVKVLPK